MSGTTDNKSINWINAAKAICILAVFYVHCEIYYGMSFKPLSAILHPFYVNAFFFVSGYLMFWKQLSSPRIDESRSLYARTSGRTMLGNIFWRIVVPSVLFALIEFFPKKIIRGEAIAVRPLLFETVGGTTYWFTSALVVAQLIFLLLFLTRNRNMWFYFLAAVVLTSVGGLLAAKGVNIVRGSSSFPWQYKQGLISMVYIAAGGLYWKYEEAVHRLFSCRWVLAAVAVVMCVLSIIFNDYLYSGYMVSLCKVHPIGVLFGICASAVLVELCKLLPEIAPLTFIGRNSIGFYFMSGALPICFSLIAGKLLPVHSPAVMLAIWAACVAVAYVVMLALMRFIPWIFDFRKLKK